jgi:hypothetical protein
MSTIWTYGPIFETLPSRHVNGPRSVAAMSSTMLTKRRAVDHCRVRSSLCRMS